MSKQDLLYTGSRQQKRERLYAVIAGTVLVPVIFGFVHWMLVIATS